MSEFHRQIENSSWTWLRNGLDDNWPTSRTGPIFVVPRIHPFTWDDLSLRGNEYSRHEPLSLSSSASPSVVLSSLYSIRVTCIWAQFGQLKMSWKTCELLIIIAQQVSLCSFIGRRVWFVVDTSGGITMVSRLSIATGFPVPFEHL